MAHQEVCMESGLAVVDVETSGLSPRRGGRVIEVAAVLLREGKVVGELESLLRVNCSIHPAAARVHGIGWEMLCHAPEPEEVWRRFLSFVGRRPLVAHNAPFDMGFIRHELALLGLPFANRSICTLRMASRRFPELASHRLEALARHLLGSIPEDCRLHRALGDARLAARVWLALNGQ
jgi:DNA polymerase-3 subunit epsilon